jgi:hypothetical protein
MLRCRDLSTTPPTPPPTAPPTAPPEATTTTPLTGPTAAPMTAPATFLLAAPPEEGIERHNLAEARVLCLLNSENDEVQENGEEEDRSDDTM